MQDDGCEGGSPSSLLPPAVASSPAGGTKLLRAQTSPSSVLDVLQSPPRGAGVPLVRARAGCAGARLGRSWKPCLQSSLPHLPKLCCQNGSAPAAPLQMSIAESPRHGDASAQGWDGLPASFGILSSMANAQKDALGALGPATSAPAPDHQPQAPAGELDQLASRLSAVSLAGGAGAGPADRSVPLDASADPFAAASQLVSSLRGSSPSSERAGGWATPLLACRDDGRQQLRLLSGCLLHFPAPAPQAAAPPSPSERRKRRALRRVSTQRRQVA